MSRLIIKNLPNKVTVEKIKEIFGEKGEVTDVQLKYTKDGKFRNFGFVGYRTEEQASAAREHFDSSYVNSMKINVEVCANLGDEKKPKAWSKYASDSTAYKKIHKNDVQDIKPKKQKLSKAERNKNKIKELLKKHKDDPLFAEFIDAHVNEKTTWIKEALEETSKSDDSGVEDEKPDEDIQQKHDKPQVNDKKQEKEVKNKVANTGISDLEYMKLLMKKVDGFEENAKETTEEIESKPKKIRNRPLFYVKITGLPYKCKKKDIKTFFKPLVPYSIRLPLGKERKLTGFCYVGFRTEKELNKALAKDKLFIGNHRVHVHKYEDQAKKAAEEEELQNSKKNQERNHNEEGIGESGSIFVRNLAYVVSEQELTQLFEKYGPLAEVNMPIDPILRQPKGFATVTFVMPEHAVKAYTQLDGTAFCGRMLHLLPAKTEKLDNDDDNDEGLSFKEKKAKKLKQQAKSSHNWNVLFLGNNAVADVVAANYNTTKEQLLSDNNKNTSAAVRLALGETQLVAETKTFLESNGVYLDAFNRPAKKRSKTCILVKNLPAGTEKDEIKVLFEKYGQLARFLMPSHGITALVDFIEPYEAKKAFGKLAYSQFKSSPLYLEWAPENVFVKSAEPQVANQEKSIINLKGKDIPKETERTDTNTQKNTKMTQKVKESKQEQINNEIIEDEQPDNNTTLFVKNINFKTTEASLREHFSGCGNIHSVTIAKKKDPKNPGKMLSMGYGFVQFVKKEHANEALKELQSSTLDGKSLELKRSERGNTTDVKSSRKSTKDSTQNGTKILVRNVPFQANRNELHEIFRAFGDIKTLRLPKKLAAGSDQHRGFAFVDYYSKADAKCAFEALCQSTHLYGRHLVLEWADQTDENEDIAMLRKRTAQSFNAKVPGGKKSRKGAVDVDTFVDPDNTIN
ncbi:probable RNA-binding protein 19 [Bicyclus anynana]|uniref:Probable RNA-binding protein 19 n=1 Tax=Bicyclus anynana TaxID=110368 RepID=A0A6J1N6C3_BICAN|nr:probable RNA-binding protein 19 [Bicyclus anynana]